MASTRERQLVVLGFGAIGAALFAYEAQQTGGYASPLVVDVRSDLVAGLRADGGIFRINIARADRIDLAEVGPVAVADSTVPAEREAIIGAIATADEFASALPSVAFYRSDAANSPHQLLAQGLARRTAASPLIVFCAENHRSAAALLEEAVLEATEPADRDRARGRARYVDTVIGKMSGIVTDADEMRSLGLTTITSALPSAFLVEEFDGILVSRVDPEHGLLHPGMPVLREVGDLAPFEDAKLLGHNATHALAAFLGQLLGLTLVADLRDVPGAMEFLRTAFIEESGRALIARYGGVDPLFTSAGYTEFADDLLDRMVNPHLADTIERAARDPRRKLGWDDRLVGLIRTGLAEGVPTPRYAMGVAAGLDVLRTLGATGRDGDQLLELWPAETRRDEADAVIAAVDEGREWLARWQRDGFPVLARG